MRLAPEHVGALSNLGAALVPSQPAEAIRLLEKAVAAQPAYVRAQYNLALAYAQSPERGADRAIAQFRKVIDLEPGFAAAHFELGKALFQKNSLPEAIAQFRETVKLDPKLGSARYQLGLALTRSGQRVEGAADLAKARVAIEEERNLETAGQLMIRSTIVDWQPIFPVAGQADRFRYDVPAELQFERDASGAVTGLVLRENGELRAARLPLLP